MKDTEIYAVTHKGKIRKENEDAVFARQVEQGVLAMVADGMGGHAAGKIASAAAIEQIVHQLEVCGRHGEITAEDIVRVIRETSFAIHQMAEANPQYSQMGTTVTLAYISGGRAYIANVGDSRAYLLHAGGELRQITQDHSFVRYLVQKGTITPEEARIHPYRNVITRAVGMQDVQVDTFAVSFAPGDMLLLCSDGLTRHLEDADIAARLGACAELWAKGEALLAAAMEAGGVDNISIILLQAGGDRV